MAADALQTYEGRRGFAAAVLALATEADDARTPAHWYWVDPDFAAWPLDDPALIAALGAWLARPGRQLTLLACGYDALVRAHPRFVDWRRPRAHLVQGWQVAIDASQMPTRFLARAPSLLELDERERWRGRSGRDPLQWRAGRELVDALMQQATPAFAVTTLGL